MAKATTKVKTDCWCGCGRTPNSGHDFVSGHDMKAAFEAIIIDWGTVQRFIEMLGYGPGMNDASLDVTYHEHVAKKSERRPRTRRPSGLKV